MQGISCSLLNGSICRKAGCRYSQVAPMAGFECRTVDAVYFVASKKPWIPQTKIVEGKKFICISKWDAGFVKFATGKSMERRASKPNNTGNFDILDEIKRLRLESCNAKVQSLIAEASVDLPEEPKAKKQKQQQGKGQRLCHWRYMDLCGTATKGRRSWPHHGRAMVCDFSGGMDGIHH